MEKLVILNMTSGNYLQVVNYTQNLHKNALRANISEIRRSYGKIFG